MGTGNDGNLCFEESPQVIHDRLLSTTDKEDFERGVIGLAKVSAEMHVNYKILSGRMDILENKFEEIRNEFSIVKQIIDIHTSQH